MKLPHLPLWFWSAIKGALIGQIASLVFVLLCCRWERNPQWVILTIFGHPSLRLTGENAETITPWLTVAFIVFAGLVVAALYFTTTISSYYLRYPPKN
jgi:hypothetical protein